jgi:uncharacterized membrane protein
VDGLATEPNGRKRAREFEPLGSANIESLWRKGLTAVPHAKRTPERLSAFSDGVFAVLITVLVLELRPPEIPTFNALLLLWPTWLSYAVSYLFIAIVWVNHHRLMHYATEATPRLVWFNFAHLFSVSLLPFSTAWMAVSRLAPQPVAFYAAVFFLVNATYVALIWELIGRDPARNISPQERKIMRFRSLITLCIFAAAAIVALKFPVAGLGLCCCCLIVYLKPEAPGAEKPQAPPTK